MKSAYCSSQVCEFETVSIELGNFQVCEFETVSIELGNFQVIELGFFKLASLIISIIGEFAFFPYRSSSKDICGYLLGETLLKFSLNYQV